MNERSTFHAFSGSYRTTRVHREVVVFMKVGQCRACEFCAASTEESRVHLNLVASEVWALHLGVYWTLVSELGKHRVRLRGCQSMFQDNLLSRYFRKLHTYILIDFQYK